MSESSQIRFPIGQRVRLEGHFEGYVLLEDARAVGGVYECRVRLSDGTLQETVISAEEAAKIVESSGLVPEEVAPANAEKLRLLIESSRIRLAYAHDKQFAVSLSGIRTLPHQIEAVYQKMLPQPRFGENKTTTSRAV